MRGTPGARWVPPENLHLTLRFIGELDRGDIPDIDDALSRISADAFEIRLDTIGFFGRGRAIRALWIKTARSPELAVLQAGVESAMVRAGCAPEARKFVPHVTLARFRARAVRPGRAICRRSFDVQAGSIPCSGFDALFELSEPCRCNLRA